MSNNKKFFAKLATVVLIAASVV
ncbi:MAG: hypothetical protein RLZZ603_1046, partial [Actinomycetota bacterium]